MNTNHTHLINQLNTLIENQVEYKKCIDEGIRFDFYYQKLTLEELEKLHLEYPDLIPFEEKTEREEIFVINLISSQILSDGRFRKLRYYINREGEIVRFLDSHWN